MVTSYGRHTALNRRGMLAHSPFLFVMLCLVFSIDIVLVCCDCNNELPVFVVHCYFIQEHDYIINAACVCIFT